MLNLLFLHLLFLHLAFSNDNSNKAQIDRHRQIEVTFENRDWNKDSTLIDVGFLVVRDSMTSKFVLLQLRETAPDSGVFRGVYQINLGLAQSVVPEVFLPDQDLIRNENTRQNALEQISSGTVARRPYLFTRNQRGQQVLNVYATRNEAKAALKRFQRERARQEAQSQLEEKELVDSKQLDAIKNKELIEKLNELKRASVEKERLRKELELAEKQRRTNLVRNFKSLPKNSREQKTVEAEKLLEQGIDLIDKDNLLAEEILLKASDLNPNDLEAYYAYGAALFRNNKFDEAIITFRNISIADKNDERDYYLGISHYRLLEFDTAIEYFTRAKSSKDKSISGSSAFYIGLIEFQQQNYDKAKKEFQFVLDYSTDPNLDKQAESYIELIMHEERFQRMRDKPFHISVTTGLNYDSNILLRPDNSDATATASDKDGIRALASFSLEWKPILDKKKEWSLRNTTTYFYSFEDKFATADPLLISFNSPFRYNTTSFNKNHRFEVDPGFELLYMDVNADGKKKNILNGYFLHLRNSFVMSERWVSAYNFSYYRNDSKIEANSPDDDSTANRYTLNFNNIVFKNREKGQIFVGDFSFVLNDAEGKTYTYNRYDFSLNYISPLNILDITTAIRAQVQLTNYDSDDNRKDKLYNFTTNFTKPIYDWLNLNASLGYTKSDSNIDSKKYDKYVIGLLLNGRWNF